MRVDTSFHRFPDLFPILGPRTARLPQPHPFQTHAFTHWIPAPRAGNIRRKASGKMLVNCPRQNFSGGILGREPNYPISISILETGVFWIVRIHAHRMVVPLQKFSHERLHNLEVADHFVLIQRLCRKHTLDLAGMSVWKTAFIRVLGQHVAILNFKRFTNSKRHVRDRLKF